MSSGAANMGMKKINFDDLQWEKPYGQRKAYCQSKLADLMFALEVGRRYTGLLSNAADPADPGYARTNLQTSGPDRAEIWTRDYWRWWRRRMRLMERYRRCAPQPLGELKGNPVFLPVPKPARDEAVARRLWEVSEKLTGVA
jgi:NAD(P)-dependent dehydrogenase (short-subunit alcohol dehydrogenase family)